MAYTRKRFEFFAFTIKKFFRCQIHALFAKQLSIPFRIIQIRLYYCKCCYFSFAVFFFIHSFIEKWQYLKCPQTDTQTTPELCCTVDRMSLFYSRFDGESDSISLFSMNKKKKQKTNNNSRHRKTVTIFYPFGRFGSTIVYRSECRSIWISPLFDAQYHHNFHSFNSHFIFHFISQRKLYTIFFFVTVDEYDDNGGGGDYCNCFVLMCVCNSIKFYVYWFIARISHIIFSFKIFTFLFLCNFSNKKKRKRTL